MTALTPAQIATLRWLPRSGDWSGKPPGDFEDTLLAMPDELVDMAFGGADFVYRITDAGLAALAAAEEVSK